MRPDQIAEARAWFQKANKDLYGAEIDLAANPPLVEDALFHCQQAAEKAMKGLLTAHDMLFRKTHDLDELARACESIEPGLSKVLMPARELTVFAWVFRYPGETTEPALDEGRRALEVARTVYASLLAHIPEAARP